ncbi:hypothetical protein KC19_VG324200 [Ceratodon purpureus]|uniref:Uncharacterized protein n=1 Tax=Ceratodon purpureus TaxID=3225 RepID=A0A8T0HXH9_CERPU|nr:hypothetical protein KC19_VG324200 [Ceratodon purpureus]
MEVDLQSPNVHHGDQPQHPQMSQPLLDVLTGWELVLLCPPIANSPQHPATPAPRDSYLMPLVESANVCSRQRLTPCLSNKPRANYPTYPSIRTAFPQFFSWIAP